MLVTELKTILLPRLLDQVDRREECDPNDVNEVPVVRDNDRCCCLPMPKASCSEGANQDDEESDEATSYMQSMEASRHVEDRTVWR